MDCCSVVRNANTYKVNLSQGRLPSMSSLTYEGKLSENYFEIMKKETEKCLTAEMSNATFINPITNKREYFLGAMTQSKFDGVGKRDCPIDIVIVIDISGSMNSNLDQSSDKSCLDLAKLATIKLLDLLKPCDRIGISIFESYAEEVLPVQHVKDKQEFLNKTYAKKIINFLKQLKNSRVYFRITEPLPRRMFGKNYNTICEEFNIPKSYQECLELYRVKNNTIYFSKDKRGSKKFSEYEDRDEIYQDFLSISDLSISMF